MMLGKGECPIPSGPFKLLGVPDNARVTLLVILVRLGF